MNLQSRHHIIIYEHITKLDEDLFPYGHIEIEDIRSFALPELVDMLTPHLSTHTIVFVEGKEESRRMLGRKLEDRLKREVAYF